MLRRCSVEYAYVGTLDDLWLRELKDVVVAHGDEILDELERE
jgi:hypothetical protein